MSGRPVRRRSGAPRAGLAAAAGAAALVGACRQEADGGRATASGAPAGGSARSANVGAAAPVTPGRPGCPHDGRWRRCSLLDRLDRAGLVPRVDSSRPPEHLAFLHAPGAVVRLGVGELHAFVYDDTAALARDVAALDTARVAPRGGTYAWSAAPTFVRSANLVAVLLTPNERQIERVQLALEGGPPNARSEVPR